MVIGRVTSPFSGLRDPRKWFEAPDSTWGSLRVQPDPGLGSMRLHPRNEAMMQAEVILEAGFIEQRDIVCFFLVCGPAFTSLKVGMGHRLDAQASGVLGR